MEGRFEWVPEQRNFAGNMAWRRVNADARCLAPFVESLVRMSRDRVAARLVVAPIVAVAVALAVGATARWGYVLAGWITGAAVCVGWTRIVVLGMDAERTAAYATRQDPTSAVSNAIVWFASVASLGGVGYLLIAESSSGRRTVVATGVGVLSVVASWIMVHTLAMVRYARLTTPTSAAGLTSTRRTRLAMSTLRMWSSPSAWRIRYRTPQFKQPRSRRQRCGRRWCPTCSAL